MPYDKKPNKRPDIATLGASLLADKRSYSKKNDRSKDDMKDLGKLLLLQMGIGIGNKFLNVRYKRIVKPKLQKISSGSNHHFIVSGLLRLFLIHRQQV